MIEITVDCNSDEVIIATNDGQKDITIDKPRNMKQLQDFVYELLNALGSYTDSRNVKLIRVDEDTRTTIEEW